MRLLWPDGLAPVTATCISARAYFVIDTSFLGGDALLTSLTFDPVGDTFTNFNFRGQLFVALQHITVTVNNNLGQQLFSPSLT